ncbi:Hypothetical protein D9617_4g001760 [Elsinoe fawcettii]|nr:Hypothetical protein D9617_4g001760 [Elsinoe fawcettii]
MLPFLNLVLAVGFTSGIFWIGSCFTQYNLWAPYLHLPAIVQPAQELGAPLEAVYKNETITSTLVVPSLKAHNPSWLSAVTWMEQKIYTVDDSSSWLTVPENKGNEAMVYLTYIVDHYDKLNDVTVFMHPDRFQWHNDDPDYDGLRMLERLNLRYVIEQGYANLRCAWIIGCQAEIWPIKEAAEYEQFHKDDPDYELRTGDVFEEIWRELIPEMPVPESVGVACCAQFAVSAEAIRKRPKADYVRYREWLLATEDDDDISGRIFEYLWHIIFGKTSTFCPVAGDCYCKLYGLCNLTCEDDDGCNEQYVFPKSIKMPKGWPKKDWDGHSRQPGTIEKVHDAHWRDARVQWLPDHPKKHDWAKHQKRKGVPAGGKQPGGRKGSGRGR